VFESGKRVIDSRNGYLNIVKVPCIVHEVRSDQRRNLDFRLAVSSELTVSVTYTPSDLLSVIMCLCEGPLYNSNNIYEELERGEAVLLERVEEARSATFSLAIQYIILKV
jgi:hypothetical protein